MGQNSYPQTKHWRLGQSGVYRQSFQAMTLALVLLFSLASPLILWPIEILLPYPYIIEEMVKAFFALSLSQNESSKKSLIFPFISGFLFTISETMLYLLNFLKLGDFSNLFKRLIYTGFLHISTTVLMYIGVKKGHFYFLTSFLFSVVIHYAFNFLIA